MTRVDNGSKVTICGVFLPLGWACFAASSLEGRRWGLVCQRRDPGEEAGDERKPRLALLPRAGRRAVGGWGLSSQQLSWAGLGS